MLCDRGCGVTHGIGDGDSELCRSVKVNIVDPCGHDADEFEAIGFQKNVAIKSDLVGQHDVSIANN